MIAAIAREPTPFPAREWGFITAKEIVVDDLTSMPRHVRRILDAYAGDYANDRVVGGQLSAELQQAGRVLVSAAEDYSALAKAELDSISPEERAETWKTVRRLRRLEERTGTKQGVTR